jgi:hypothetical protein
VDNRFELYSVPIAGGTPVKLNGPLPAGGEVSVFVFSPDSATVVYGADQEVDNRSERYRVSASLDVDGLEGDGDGWGDLCDCAMSDPSVYPGAPEVNDGQDNQCPGDPGQGVADETSDASGFFDPDDPNAYSWEAQPGASLYEVARSLSPDMQVDCALFGPLAATTLVDADPVPAGAVYYYLNRAIEPHAGSWGQDSAGQGRQVPCAP